MVGLCKNVGRTVAACAVVALAGMAVAGQPATFESLREDVVPFPGPVVGDRGSPCAIAANCQGVVGNAGYTGRTSDLVPLPAAPVADFGTADNFTLTSPQTVTSLCFWGFYGAVDGTAPAAGAECFRIRFHANNTSGGVGHPDPAVLPGGEFVIGANPRFGTITPDTTITRLSGTGTSITLWTVTLPTGGLSLPAGCYWVEIVGNTSTITANDRFRWGISDGPVNPNGSQDNAFAQKDNALAWAANQVVGNAGDRAFCLNFALETNSCGIPPVPPNATCATAQTITAPFSVTNASTLFAFNQATPFCGFNPVNGNTVWYRVVGDGSTMTASTCGAGTDFDTVINVYCRTAGTCGTSNANLNCVANNDTGPASCTGTGAAADPSEVTWATAPGVEYLIAVFGFQITSGFFDFSLTSTAGTPGGACVSDRCPIDTTGITPVEVDACGVSTNSSCAGAGVGTFTFGDDFRGVIYNLGTSRDFDFWECASVIPDTVGDGTAWLDVDYTVEFPGIFNFFFGACSGGNGTFLGGAFAIYTDGGPACPRTQQTIQLNTLAGSPFRLNLLPVDFGGVPCAANANDYVITVRLSTLGACCVPAQQCNLTVEADCVDVQGGTFIAAATSCTPVDPCSAPVEGACCQGSTCSLQTAANCPMQPGQRYAGDNTVCNAMGNNTMPCCKADFNQDGTLGVQDIFDFLAAYFSNNPNADFNGGGIGVQDIFDFLAAYFAGCA